MKIKRILTLSFVGSSFFLLRPYTNKNFMLPKPPCREISMENAGWYHVRRDADNKDQSPFGGSLQCIAFYKRSTGKDKLGAYFGVKDKNVFTYGEGSTLSNDIETEDLLHNAIPNGYSFTFAGNNFEVYIDPADNNKTKLVQPGTTTIVGLDDQPIATSLIDSATNEATAVQIYSDSVKNSALRGTFILNPRRTVYGLKFSYYANMHRYYYFKMDVPILRVEHELRAEVNEEKKFVDPQTGNSISMLDLVSGSYSKEKMPFPENKDQQSALLYATIPTEKVKETGFGDIDLTFGYKFLDESKSDLSAYVKLVAPAGKQAKSKVLFEPILGNGQHFELAAGIEGSSDLFDNGIDSIEADFDFNVGFMFRRDMTRTIASKIDKGVRLPWQRYVLVAKTGSTGALQPMANISTMPVQVQPGWRAEGTFSIGYRRNWFVADIGYSFYARESEKITVKEWKNDGNYALVAPYKYRTDQTYSLTEHSLPGLNTSPFDFDELDPNSAATPGIFTNMVFINAAFYNKQLLPVIVGAGAGYEFGSHNSTIEGFTAWVKLAMSF